MRLGKSETSGPTVPVRSRPHLSPLIDLTALQPDPMQKPRQRLTERPPGVSSSRSRKAWRHGARRRRPTADQEPGTNRSSATFFRPVNHIASRPPAGPKAGSVRKDEIRVACEAILQRLDDYIDRELSADDVLMIERHLEECFDCASQYRFEIGLIHDIRARLRRIALPGDLMTRIRLRLDAETVG